MLKSTCYKGDQYQQTYNVHSSVTLTIFPQYAIHLMQEGKDNEEPCDNNKHSLRAYTIVHHWLYYWSSFIAALILMLLAFWEEPAVPTIESTFEEKAVRDVA